MNNLQSILLVVDETLNSLPDGNNLEQFGREFPKIWWKLGNFVPQQLWSCSIILLRYFFGLISQSVDNNPLNKNQ